MTNDSIRRKFDACERIEGFGARHRAAFTAGSRAAGLFSAMTATGEAMRQAGAGQLSGTGKYRGGTSAKAFWNGELREDLAAIRSTAESISEAEDTPEFEDQFRLPRSSSYDAWVTAARAFLKDATAHKALFVEFEMPADFLDDLAADIKGFEDAQDTQAGGLGDQVGGTANLDALAMRGMTLRKQLQAVVRNKFRDDAAVLAEWETAQHVERAPRAAKKPAAA